MLIAPILPAMRAENATMSGASAKSMVSRRTLASAISRAYPRTAASSAVGSTCRTRLRTSAYLIVSRVVVPESVALVIMIGSNGCSPLSTNATSRSTVWPRSASSTVSIGEWVYRVG